jgi:SOS-response transcriptional repressor LexA
MSKLSTILKALMAEVHISESELARRTGIGQPVVHRIASGETDNPKVGTLSPIAKYFGLSISHLIGHEPLPAGRLAGTFNPEVSGWTQVPLLTWEQALEWPKLGTSQALQNISTDLEIAPESFALEIKDTTMAPRFPEGTLIVVDTGLRPRDRDYAVVHINNHKSPTFKQILIDGHSTYLKPINPDFKTIELEKDKYRFLGVMVQARMDFKRANPVA